MPSTGGRRGETQLHNRHCDSQRLVLFSVRRDGEVTPPHAIFRPYAQHEDLHAEQVFTLMRADGQKSAVAV